MTPGAKAKRVCWAPKGPGFCGKLAQVTMREDGSAGSRCACGLQYRVSPAEAADINWPVSP